MRINISNLGSIIGQTLFMVIVNTKFNRNVFEVNKRNKQTNTQKILVLIMS